MLTRTTLLALLAPATCTLLLSGGCDRAPTANTTAEHTPHVAPPATTLPAGIVVRGTAAGAVPVGECKANARQGETVTVLGRIGGSRLPFVKGRAMFTIVDPAIKTCGEGAEPDHCRTPWDYCCEPRENLTRNMATIEVVGADGKTLPFSLSGAEGLEPTVTVAVTGTVTERNDQGLFVVRAEKISIQ